MEMPRPWKTKDSFPPPLGKAKRRLSHIPTAPAASDKFRNLRKRKEKRKEIRPPTHTLKKPFRGLDNGVHFTFHYR
jgi:hypothetical protein